MREGGARTAEAGRESDALDGDELRVIVVIVRNQVADGDHNGCHASGVGGGGSRVLRGRHLNLVGIDRPRARQSADLVTLVVGGGDGAAVNQQAGRSVFHVGIGTLPEHVSHVIANGENLAGGGRGLRLEGRDIAHRDGERVGGGGGGAVGVTCGCGDGLHRGGLIQRNRRGVERGRCRRNSSVGSVVEGSVGRLGRDAHRHRTGIEARGRREGRCRRRVARRTGRLVENRHRHHANLLVSIHIELEVVVVAAAKRETVVGV